MKIKELNEGQHNFIDILLKIIGGLFIVASTIIGIVKFHITKEREFLIILYKDEIESLKEIVETTAKIAVYPKDSKTFAQADSTFNQLRTGNISFLNDSLLYKKVTKYYVAKEKYKSGSGAITKQELHTISIEIANYSRNKIEETMKLK